MSDKHQTIVRHEVNNLRGLIVALHSILLDADDTTKLHIEPADEPVTAVSLEWDISIGTAVVFHYDKAA